MDFLLEALTNWLKEMLVGGIMSNLSGMFDSVNQQVADISVQVGQTPQGWNGSIFNMIEKIVVHECSYDENGTRRQDIEIYYSFVGKIDLPEA